MEPITVQRSVRSYALRGGRLTTAQRRALDQLWPRFGLAPDRPLDWAQTYLRIAPRIVEVGFGNGDALLALAEKHPDWDFLGIEVYPPGIGRLLTRVLARNLSNIRVMRADAVEVFDRCLVEDSLDEVLIWFPDPWPKTRHHKRRLVQPQFVDLVTQRLKSGGRLHLATDWEAYAEQMLGVLEAQGQLENLAGPGRFSQNQGERPVTRFQERGEALGHRVWDLFFERRSEKRSR